MSDLATAGALLALFCALLFVSFVVRDLSGQVADLETQIEVTDRTLCQRVEEARC